VIHFLSSAHLAVLFMLCVPFTLIHPKFGRNALPQLKVRMKEYAVIVAGGTGSRMQHALPKQFMELAGEPVLLRTLRIFHKYNPDMGLVVVMHPDYVNYWRDLHITMGSPVPHQLVEGGKTRFYSVKAGLAVLSGHDSIVAIHDAVRPLVSLATLRNCFDAAREYGAAVPVVTLNESLRAVAGNSSTAVNRDDFRLVQTPQCFRLVLIQAAYQQPYLPEFTDDASVAERNGTPIRLVTGNRENIKLTSSEDMRIARALLQTQQGG
jgi:2-C-methyl-D-erythritol 4-phosphate cytidylyltransferase